MLAALGEMLPFAVGTALSPIPLIAIVLVLMGQGGRRSGSCFVLGRLLGIGVLVTLVTLLAEVLPDSQEVTAAGGWLRIALGAGLIWLAVTKWRKRPGADAEPELPGWMSSLDSLSGPRAFGTGLLISAINPKELAFAIGAGIAIAAAGPGLVGDPLLLALYTVLAGSSVLVPLLVYLAAAGRLDAGLRSLQTWLVANNVAIIAVVLLVLGALMIGNGLEAL